MNSWISCIEKLFEKVSPVGPLLLRLWLAQEFISAGLTKLSGGLSAPEWFAGLQFPFPVSWLPVDANWLLAGVAEIVLGSLLLIGLAGRFAALGLVFVTWVAVYSVHFDLGWAGWNQIETESGLGFKVPLMLAIMLLVLACTGMGRWSIDAWWQRRWNAAS
ncbi:DoxX family protein [Pseudomonas asiatica]|uniref:HvfX family Cu-binding RiPP maturation protein n=1 Tax=Pseudomonas TaxID=286 RepID=UPI0010BFF9F9|nr:DoxX family protein [Pseudomonas juntendi]MCF3158988.1 DoxX family protein [Pseudomonas juntendi]GJB83767.1 membrane protein [Aeromonas caviae]